MNQTATTLVDPIAVAAALAEEFAASAAERDRRGGTAKAERDRIRESGLLRLIVPRECGGGGADWPTALQVVRTIAQADASLGHLLGYHYLEVVTPHLLGTPEQRARYYAATARENWFWGNALNPLDRRVTYTGQGAELRLSGVKSFCTGAKDSDVLLVSAVQEGTPGLLAAVVPTRREGITVNDDWDNMGQRLTDSGSVVFEDVVVRPEEVLGPPGPGGSVFATLRTCITQLILTNIYVGLALGALEEARRYVRTSARPWPASGVAAASQDPYVLQHFGRMWTDSRAAACLADEAAWSLQQAWEQEEDLTAEGRGACAVAVSAAKVLAARVSLDVTSQIFEVMGARATGGQYRVDRFWRNARTMTLHDPLDYKVREVGEWALNGTLPTPGFYS